MSNPPGHFTSVCPTPDPPLRLEDTGEKYLNPVQWEGRVVTQMVGPLRWTTSKPKAQK